MPTPRTPLPPPPPVQNSEVEAKKTAAALAKRVEELEASSAPRNQPAADFDRQLDAMTRSLAEQTAEIDVMLADLEA